MEIMITLGPLLIISKYNGWGKLVQTTLITNVLAQPSFPYYFLIVGRLHIKIIQDLTWILLKKKKQSYYHSIYIIGFQLKLKFSKLNFKYQNKLLKNTQLVHNII